MKAQAFLFSLGVLVVVTGAWMPITNDHAAEVDATPQTDTPRAVQESVAPKQPAANAARSSEVKVKQIAEINKRLEEVSTNFLGAVGDVVKLYRAGVDPSTIQAFIENSNNVRVPSADEILRLHNLGIPESLIAGLIRRGGAVRGQQSEVSREAQDRTAQQQLQGANPSPPIIVAPPLLQPTYVQPPTYNYIVSPTYVPPVYPTYSYAYDWWPSFSYYYPSYRYRTPYRFSTWTFYNFHSPRRSFGHGGFPNHHPNRGTFPTRHDNLRSGTFHRPAPVRSFPAHSARPAFHSGRHGSRM